MLIKLVIVGAEPGIAENIGPGEAWDLDDYAFLVHAESVTAGLRWPLVTLCILFEVYFFKFNF